MSENEKTEIVEDESTETEPETDEEQESSPIADQGPLENAEPSNVVELNPETEEESDEEPEEEESGSVDHPLDILMDTIDSINSQMARVKKSKGIHNLKHELMYNVYPTIVRGFEAISDYMSGIEQEDEDAITQEIAIAQLKEILTICVKIEHLKTLFLDFVTEDSDKKLWTEVTDWSEDIISKADEGIIKEVIKDIPEIESSDEEGE